MTTIPQDICKEYINYIGTLILNVHDEHVEIDFYWNNNKKRSLNVGENKDNTTIPQRVRHYFCNYDVCKRPMRENQLGFVMAQEELELIWNLKMTGIA